MTIVRLSMYLFTHHPPSSVHQSLPPSIHPNLLFFCFFSFFEEKAEVACILFDLLAGAGEDLLEPLLLPRQDPSQKQATTSFFEAGSPAWTARGNSHKSIARSDEHGRESKSFRWRKETEWLQEPNRL